MHIPNAALKYILFQRTSYLLFTNNVIVRALRKVIPFVSYEKMIDLEVWLSKERIKTKYISDIGNEYLSIKDFLPTSCSRVLDIGCGIAGINVLLHRHYQNQELQFFLLDKSQVETRVFYGFKRQGAFYNSLFVAKGVLTRNGILESSITTLEASEDNAIPINGNIDLVVSLLSWGFHYPVETYVHTVHQRLTEQGRLILDVRKETEGLSVLKDCFSECRIIAEAKKHARVLCIK